MTTMTVGLKLGGILCGEPGCGITFWMDATRVNELIESQGAWWCPNGHRRYFAAETEVEKLRKQLATAQGNLNYYQNGYKRLRGEVQSLERSRAAVKGQVTKLRKRAAHGVCAACNRTFANVARHMASQHPNFESTNDDQ
jgi:hypothetical protein